MLAQSRVAVDLARSRTLNFLASMSASGSETESSTSGSSYFSEDICDADEYVKRALEYGLFQSRKVAPELLHEWAESCPEALEDLANYVDSTEDYLHARNEMKKARETAHASLQDFLYDKEKHPLGRPEKRQKTVQE